MQGNWHKRHIHVRLHHVMLQEERQEQQRGQSEPQRSFGMPRESQSSYGTASGLMSDPTCRSYGGLSKEPKTQNIDTHRSTSTAIAICVPQTVREYLKRGRGSWVGVLYTWCHCAHSQSGDTLPLHRDAAQPPRQTPRVLPDSRLQHGKTKEERREGGSTSQTDRPDAPGLKIQSPCLLAELNKQILQGGVKLCLRIV